MPTNPSLSNPARLKSSAGVAGDVALASRALELAGLGDMVWGHVSLRNVEPRGVWMKSSGLGLGEVADSDVVLVGSDGTLLQGSGRVHIECHIHTQIMAARPDVSAVVHCHPTHSIAFAATGRPLLPMSHEGVLFCPPDIAVFTGTTDLICTAARGAELAAALGDRNAILLPSHGIVTVGPDLATAVMTAVLLERACHIQLLAEAAGGVNRWTPDSEVEAKRNRCWAPSQIAAGYAYLCRQVQRQPG